MRHGSSDFGPYDLPMAEHNRAAFSADDVEDAKRGAPVTCVADTATRFAEEASRLIAARKRRVRSGYVTLA